MSEQDSNNKMENTENKEDSKKKTFVERIFHDDIEGEYDDQGFFNTPNGSFWDPDGVYFNREGFDKHGGYYDENNVYIPGKGWDEENNCYKDELDDEFASDHDPNDDEDGFGDIDMDKIQDEAASTAASSTASSGVSAAGSRSPNIVTQLNSPVFTTSSP